jgi:hypothetical protein
MMGRVYDFWLGERITPDMRYKKRHKRDGLCHQCSRKAVEGQSLCPSHRDLNNTHIRQTRETMKQKIR